MPDAQRPRRAVLRDLAVLGAGAVLPGCASSGAGKDKDHEQGGDQDVPPGEDLMREHGVLKRVLLVYAECARRLDAGEDTPPDAVADGAEIIRTFIEDYHERLEEDYLFPRFRRSNVLVPLVDTLTAQHQAGRRVTEETLHLATPASIRDPADRRRLGVLLRSFIRMYEPHEAREDTVLFPALRKIVSAHEYAAMGEEFEKIERRRFGQDGFERMVDRVAGIEKRLGIYELAQFTPGA